jgi:hypothetical protein
MDDVDVSDDDWSEEEEEEDVFGGSLFGLLPAGSGVGVVSVLNNPHVPLACDTPRRLKGRAAG